MDAIDEDSMESDGGLGSGGRERKSLTGFDLAGRYLRSVVHCPISTI